VRGVAVPVTLWLFAAPAQPSRLRSPDWFSRSHHCVALRVCAESGKLPVRVSFAARAVLSRCSLYEALRYETPPLFLCSIPLSAPSFCALLVARLLNRLWRLCCPSCCIAWPLCEGSDFRKLVKGASRNARVLIHSGSFFVFCSLTLCACFVVRLFWHRRRATLRRPTVLPSASLCG
jgi:hypothetical protein